MRLRDLEFRLTLGTTQDLAFFDFVFVHIDFGGTLELGETLEQGVARELLEETGIAVRVLELIEVFDRIYGDDGAIAELAQQNPRFHYVIVDYLCERIAGEPRAGSDVTDVAFAPEDQLGNYHLTETATRILKKAFAMDRARRGRS